jgi:hypothetical protein
MIYQVACFFNPDQPLGCLSGNADEEKIDRIKHR